MLDKFYYLNNFGEKINFGMDGIYACYNDLRDYEWSYESSNNIITGFIRGIKTKKLPVIFLSGSGEKTRKLRNKAYEIAEKDILAGKGFGIEDARNAINIVYDIRHAEPIGLKGDYHPLAKLPLAKHPFGW